MKKVYLILAAAAGMTLASCTNSDYIGDVTAQQNGNGVISFGGGTGKMTRSDATGGDAATKLNNEMKVYGVKNLGSNYGDVFVNYVVNYNTSMSDQSDYNNGWYYVFGSQYIKYWDYSCDNYHFVAGSPVTNFTYAVDGTTKDIKTATVTGLGGRLIREIGVDATNAPVYIADPVNVSKPAGYNQEVEFTFRAMQSKVRVGIYETIPGYSITDIKFYSNADVERNYITLNSETSNYFQGGSSVTATVRYNWESTPTYTFTYGDGLESRQIWEGGQFKTGVPATSSADATTLYGTLEGTEANHKDANGYFIVMPTPSATVATDLTIKCDYTLTSNDGSGETINVTGATATIPSDYTKWEINKAYTYLFKISDNTNGSTGDPSTDPVGLYPIVFDAVVVDFEDNKVGTETTVSTPSITCYQVGDVVDTTSPAEHGIKFVTGADIIVKVTEESDIEVKRLSGAFDYTKTYDAQAYDGASASFDDVTEATLTSLAAKTYVIKATSTANPERVAYFVLVVSEPEVGPTNP